MLVLQRIAVGALGVYATLRSAFSRTVPHFTHHGMIERGRGRTSAAMVTGMHVTGLALSSSYSGPRAWRLMARRPASHDSFGFLQLEGPKSARNVDRPMLSDLFPTDGEYANATRLHACTDTAPPVATVLPYSGTKALVVYELDRPRALVTYQPPINFIRFCLDPRPYQLVVFVYRPLFQAGARLSKEYAHLDSRDFAHLAPDVADDPVERELAMNRSRDNFRTVFNLEPQMYPTIGEARRRPEENASRVLILIHGLGILATLTCAALSALCRLLVASRPAGASLPLSGAIRPSLSSPLVERVRLGSVRSLCEEVAGSVGELLATYQRAYMLILIPELEVSRLRGWWETQVVAPVCEFATNTVWAWTMSMDDDYSPVPAQLDTPRTGPPSTRKSSLRTHSNPRPTPDPLTPQRTPAYKALGWRRRLAD